MSDVFFEELEIPELHYHLGIGSGTQGEQTGKMLEALKKLFLRERPDVVLVYGEPIQLLRVHWLLPSCTFLWVT